MTEINRLNRSAELEGADLLPIWDADDGATRAVRADVASEYFSDAATQITISAITAYDGTISASPAWADIPKHGDPDFGDELDAQSLALAARSEWLRGIIINVKDPMFAGGAIGDGIADDTSSFNALTTYLRSNFVDVDYDYAGISLFIPPGVYSVSSWDLTNLLINNVHVIGHGAVLTARTAGKHVIDAIGSRYIKWHGLMVYSSQAVKAKSGIQIGPRGTEACGNFSLNDVTIAGYFTHATYMNLGAETTSLFNTRLLQRDTDPNVYAQICDGLSVYLPTSDYATITRTAGTAVSFTNDSYHACQMRNEGGGSASFLAKTQGWDFDKGCYHLSFNDSAVVIYSTGTNRTEKLTLRGSFESAQDNNPTPGNIGLRYAVTFAGDGANTAIDGFIFEPTNLDCATAVFRNTSAGTIRLSNADMRIYGISEPGCSLIAPGGGVISIDGVLMSQVASKLNLAPLGSFNGIIELNDYSALASAPVAGSYTVYSRADNRTYHAGTEIYVDAPFSFTPQVTFATPGDMSVTYTQQVGQGYRIGKLVYFQISLTFAVTHTTASGEFRITGLPFPAVSGGSRYNAMLVPSINTQFTWPASVTSIFARLPESDSTLRLLGQGSSVGTTIFTSVNVPSSVTSKVISITGMYMSA